MATMTKMLAVSALTGALAQSTCGFTRDVGTTKYTCGDIKVNVNIPEQCVTGSCGLIVDVHGYIMSAEIQDKNTNMRALGEQNDFVVIQPTAPGSPPFTSWSGAEDPQVYAATVEIRDLLNIDPLRFHFTGFSQGAMMTWRFLARYADELASVAPISFTPSWGSSGPPTDQIPVLFSIGTKDGFVNFADSQRTADQLVKAWDMTNSTVLGQDENYLWTRFENDIGNTFEFLHHDYSDTCFPYPFAGHCFPGSQDTCGGSLSGGQIVHFNCNGDPAYNIGEEVMNFFLAHPKSK